MLSSGETQVRKQSCVPTHDSTGLSVTPGTGQDALLAIGAMKLVHWIHRIYNVGVGLGLGLDADAQPVPWPWFAPRASLSVPGTRNAYR